MLPALIFSDSFESNWDDGRGQINENMQAMTEILDESATGLHAFSTTKAGETGYLGSGEVPGYLLNQWSLSEHRGVLRVVSTERPAWWGPGLAGAVHEPREE